jgi:hypothetical protein
VYSAEIAAEEDRMRRHPVSIAVSILVLVLALMGCRPATAQSPPASSPETLAAASELVAASHAAEQLKTLLPLIMQQLKPAIVQGRPEIARDYDVVMPALIESMTARSDAFAAGIAEIYAHTFTADELRQVTAFYHSPVGQRFLEKMPVIAQESMAMGQKFGQEVAGEMRNRMIEELRKRGHAI